MAANEFITQIVPVRNNNIVRVSTDSDKNLEELFRAVIGPKDCQFPISKPMRQRNLPASFFTPPETGSKSASHSRESSIDQAKPYVKQILLPSQAKNIQIQQSQNGSNQHITQAASTEEQQLIINQQIQQQKISLLNRAGIQIVHPRAHSSPATLQQTLNVPLNNGNVANQQLNTAQQNSPQPAQNTPTTTQQTVQADVTIQHIRQLSDINQIPLPEGWEQAVDQGSGRIYFINHNNKTTTWQDPRLATQQLKLLQLQQFEQQKAAQQQLQQQQQIQQQIQFQQQAQQQQQLQQFQQPQQQLLQQQQTIVIQNNNIILQNSPLNHQVNGKLPDGWEERKTEDGETYYINHNNCTTSWFDPRIPIQLQKPNLLNANQINRPPPELNANDVNLIAALNNNSQNIIQNENLIQQNTNTNGNHQNSSPQQLQTQQQIQQSQTLVIQQQAQNVQHNSHQQTMQNDHQLRVQQLQLECEKMRQRQQEIQNQQRLFTPNINDNNESVSPNHGISTTGMDPFLGGTLLTGESHSRQESADSGLGLCNNYSLPHTPEAMLDSDLDEHNYVTTTEDLGLDSLAITSMDLGENMESDDLLPNLPDEISCPDIHLSDIDAILAGNSSSRDNWI